MHEETLKTSITSRRASSLTSIRQKMREQFPIAHETRNPSGSSSSSANLPPFPSGALSELTPAHPSSGLSLILAEILRVDLDHTHGESNSSDSSILSDEPIALIDGRNSFDPGSYDAESCSRLLWIRCHDSKESLRCCDLLLHDENLSLLVLDLLLTPPRELHLIPSSSWYRFRNLAKRSNTAVLIFTPQHLIPCAALQLSLDSSFPLSALKQDRHELKPTYSHRKIALHNS
ncbi:MAG TPA: hypothetical protein DIV39_07600 [Verrucomicrobiales bacterium]|nr:hypothetical protein [Verrucomicrobiales bacterium]